MSWFGETFGDSLNSLKGQITKITKEVLADEEGTSSERQESEDNLVKELEALCESKDLEIAALREELNKVHSQNKSEIEFTNENCSDVRLQKLQKELSEIKHERDYLNICLENLQTEHETNIEQLITLKDKYKTELEVLNKEYNDLKTKLNEINISDTKGKNEETQELISRINELEVLLEREKEKSLTSLNNEKEKANKLLSDIDMIRAEKEKINEDQQNILRENDNLKMMMIEKEKEKETKLKFLETEKEDLLKKCHVNETKISDLLKTQTEVEDKLKHLLQLLNVDIKGITNENNIKETLNFIENKVQQKWKEINENWKKSTNNLELEIQKLKEENKNFENQLKITMESSKETEKKYKEEVSCLKNSISEIKNSGQVCINQSQTDDVKRLEQEIAQCMSQMLLKNNQINDYSKSIESLEQELKNSKALFSSTEQELLATKTDKEKLEGEIVNLKDVGSKINEEKAYLEKKIKILEAEKTNLDNTISKLQINNNELEKQLAELTVAYENIQQELKEMTDCKLESEKMLQNENLNYKNEFEHIKAEVIIKESALVECMKANTFFQEELHKLQSQNNELLNSEKEVKKWKDASIDLQIQQEDLIAKKEELENECLRLKNEFETGTTAKDAEIQQHKLANSNLMKSYCELEEKLKKQTELILQLEEENTELKCRIQKFQEQLKAQVFQTQNQPAKDDVLQHKRSKSDVDTDMLDVHKSGCNNEDLTLLKEILQQEKEKYQVLQYQFQDISNKEANARKEFERLKQHLIEVEDHYTEEAVQNEKIINDLKSKLIIAEEQLQNSSTLYTSLKVRDNQHLESLQSQIRMISVQRDDFQAKLSAAEDEIQKHKASLMSLQIVLEQFQQDKEREVEEVAMKYENQLQQSNHQFKDSEIEIQGLRNQLIEAKNGLKAASRLGEQLEKKTKQVSELEENLNVASTRIAELEKSLATADQASDGKIDKSLIKNLVIGYILSSNADRKSQVFRIMASVLDFDQEERNKMGVEAGRSGWLSSILHPKGEGPPSSESLSEAFIKFLENESRPQPKLKLLPEQVEVNASKTSSPKPSGHLSELMLPTFNSSQENESSIILKNVLKDS